MITYDVRYTLTGKTKVVRLDDSISTDAPTCDEDLRKELQWRWAAVRGTPDVEVSDFIVRTKRESA